MFGFNALKSQVFLLLLAMVSITSLPLAAIPKSQLNSNALTQTDLANGSVGMNPVATKIEVYLTKKGSPMVKESGFINALMDAAQVDNLDPRVLIALASAETSLGLQARCSNNAWNWNCVGDNRRTFETYAVGARTVALGIRALYLDGGVWKNPNTSWLSPYYHDLLKAGYIKDKKLTTVQHMAWVYVPPPTAWAPLKHSGRFSTDVEREVTGWIRTFSKVMTDLGGNPEKMSLR
jgi:hypothetical protein